MRIWNYFETAFGDTLGLTRDSWHGLLMYHQNVRFLKTWHDAKARRPLVRLKGDPCPNNVSSASISNIIMSVLYIRTSAVVKNMLIARGSHLAQTTYATA